MSSLSRTVDTTRKIIIGFMIFAALAIIGQFLITRIPKIGKNPGNPKPSYFLSATKNTSDYKRLKLNSIAISGNSKPQFIKVDDFNYVVDTVNVYNLAEPAVSIRSIAISNEIARIFELDTKTKGDNPNVDKWTGSKNDFIFQYDRRYESVLITRNLQNASKDKISNDLDKETITSSANSLMNSLRVLNAQELDLSDPRIDYIALNSANKFENVAGIESAHFVRVTWFANLESSTILKRYANSQSTTIPTTKISDVIFESNISGNIVLYLKGNMDSIDDIVQTEYTPIQILNSNIANFDKLDHTIPFKFEVYSAIEVEQAFQNLQNGTEGSYLIYLNKRGTNIFDTPTNISVKQFLFDATGVEVVYYMKNPKNASSEERQLYPFYAFKGVATLSDNSQADFVFLVDAVAK